MLRRIQACSCLLTYFRLTSSMFSSSILGLSDLLKTMALNTVGPIVHTLTWRHLSLWLYEHRWDNLCPFVALIHLYAKVTHPAKNLHQRFGFLLLIYGKVHTYRLSTKCWRWVNDKTIVFNDISTTFHLRYSPGNKTTIAENFGISLNSSGVSLWYIAFRTTEPSRVYRNFCWECHTLMCPSGCAGYWLDPRVTSTTQAHPPTRAGIDSPKWS